MIGYVVGRVMFSVYASLQHDRPAVKRIYLENLQRIALFSLPVALALVLAADPIVPGLLGERWSPAIGPLRLLGVYGLVRAFFAPSNEVFKGLGHPKYGLLSEIGFSLPVLPALFLLVPPLGLNGAPLALLTGLALAGIPAFVVTLRLLDARLHEIVHVLYRPFSTAGVVGIVLAVSVHLTEQMHPASALLVVAASGLVSYLAGSVVFTQTDRGTMWTNAKRTA